MMVHKIEVMVLDFEGLGADEVKMVLQNALYPNNCVYPDVMSIETRDIEWYDLHPLNMADTSEAEFKKMFNC